MVNILFEKEFTSNPFIWRWVVWHDVLQQLGDLKYDNYSKPQFFTIIKRKMFVLFYTKHNTTKPAGLNNYVH